MDIDYQVAYTQLKAKVKLMMATQKDFFKTRDPAKLRTAKALEKEVEDMLNPKPSSQAKIDWLGQ